MTTRTMTINACDLHDIHDVNDVHSRIALTAKLHGKVVETALECPFPYLYFYKEIVLKIGVQNSLESAFTIDML